MPTEELPSKDRWRIFANCVPDFAFILINLKGEITDWNVGAKRCWGTPRIRRSVNGSVSFSIPKTGRWDTASGDG